MEVMTLKRAVFEKVIFGKTRVVLTSEHYGVERGEPVYGSEHECMGTIVAESDEPDTPVVVNWDNGEGNYYKLEDLRAVVKTDDSNPNSSFRRKKSEDIKKKRQEHQRRSKQNLTKAIKSIKDFKPSKLSNAEKGTEVHKAYSDYVKKTRYDKPTQADLSEFDRHSEDEHDR
jgi:hypothetical protein